MAGGLTFFCAKLPALLNNEQWDVRDRSQRTPGHVLGLIRDLPGCDLAYSWAGRINMGKFLWAARCLGVRKVVLFWCGSDVLHAKKLLALGKMDPWVASRIHWAASPSLAEEVRSLGLRCEFVQASFVEPVASPKPLPRKFSVLVFMPRADRGELYGWDRIVDVAQSLPSVDFQLVGLHPGQTLQGPANICMHYFTSDLTPFYEQATVLWRPVRHDAGVSFMVLEALAHGRHVLYTYPIPGATQVSGAGEAKRQLEHLRELNAAGNLPLNHAGMQSIRTTYARDVVRNELHRRWEDIIAS
ncbi:MAG: hypothetical protein LAN59_02960 [Acidobacteriia bacterium]|nr:hypothetical protein [Terriglobia bacterium]